MENCSALDANIRIGSNIELEDGSSTALELMEAVNDRPGTPTELIEAASDARKNLLPKKSNDRYEQAFNSFEEWKKAKGATSNSERTLMAYFNELEKKYAPSTLWSKYSMLKATLSINYQIDISAYLSLTAMLKQANKGYVAKQAKTFTESEVQRFVDTAPDIAWLDVKVVCAFGLCGACRTHELPTIRMQDIARYDDMYYVTVPRTVTKTGNENAFAITGPLLDYVRRYESLRPSHATTDRFFLNFQKGKCTVQTIGKAKFYQMPRRIAEFLKIPDTECYTGHSIRRSSVTIYANTGATIEALKRHSGHKSTKVCEMYIDNSMAYKKKTGRAITASINCTSTSDPSRNSSDMREKATSPPSETNPFNIATDSSHTDILSDSFEMAMNDHNVQSLICADKSSDMVGTAARSKPNSAEMDTPLITAPCATAIVTDSAIDRSKPFNDITKACGSTNKQNRDHAARVQNESNVDFHHANADANEEDVENFSQNSISSQPSTQNFLAQLHKRFAFYKCNNLTINFKK